MVAFGILANVLAWSVIAYILYSLTIAVYNITLHPLAKFPGPKLYGAFHFIRMWHLLKGDIPYHDRALHDEYGPVVRMSPSYVSFNTSQAIQDIYSRGKGNQGLDKDMSVYGDPLDPTSTEIVSSNYEDHVRFKRLISHGFSESALREQEAIIHGYCDLLINKLYEQIKIQPEGKVDLVRWINFTTFDIIGDLVFGESFDALEKGEYHHWIVAIFGNLKAVNLLRVIRTYPLIWTPFLGFLKIYPPVIKGYRDLERYQQEKTRRRLTAKTDRKDIMSHILRHNDEKGMTETEIIDNAGTLSMAGSETSATLLGGLFFHLLTNPPILEKVIAEVLHTFKSPKEMTLAAETKLPYLQACIEEALRIYPPAPLDLLRKTPPAGAMIAGQFVPGNTSVAVPHFTTFSSASNFKDPLEYKPERWLGDPKYADDDLSACQPFSTGARGCLGKTLAYAEIRSIAIRVLWNFNIEICPESEGWQTQNVYFLWEKPPLWVKLSAREHESE